MSSNTIHKTYFEKDIDLKEDAVIRIGGIIKLSASGIPSGNLILGGNTITTSTGPIILDPNGQEIIQINKSTIIVSDTDLKFQNVSTSKTGIRFDSITGQLRLLSQSTLTGNPKISMGFYTSDNPTQSWNEAIALYTQGYIDVRKPSGSTIQNAGYFVEGLQVIKDRQPAVSDTNASQTIPTINSGSTTISTQNGFSDLLALRDAVDNLRSSFETLRTNVNSCLARLRTHGLIYS